MVFITTRSTFMGKRNLIDNSGIWLLLSFRRPEIYDERPC